MNKYAAEKIAQEYHSLGIKLAFEQAGIKLADPEKSKKDKALDNYLVSDPIPSVKKKSKPTPSKFKANLGGLTIGKMKLPEDRMMEGFERAALANPRAKNLPQAGDLYGLTLKGKF